MRRARTAELAAAAAALPVHKCGHWGHLSKRTGRPCRAQVVAGTQHCKDHAGKTLEQHKAEGQIRIAVSQWTLDGHDGGDIDPKVEILRLISFWKWRANLYGQLLEKAYAAAERLGVKRRGTSIVSLNEPEWEASGDDVLLEHPALQTARKDLDDILRLGGVTAFIGHQYDVDRHGRIYAVTEGIRALVTLEERAHTMLAKFCNLAVQAKVAESRVQLEEQAGVMIQAIILGTLRDLSITADPHVMDIIAANIDTVTATPSLTAA